MAVMERSSPRLWLPLVASLALHAGALLLATQLPERAEKERTTVELEVVTPKPPPPPPPPPEPEPPQPPPEKAPPKIARPKEALKQEPAPPPSPEPPPETPPPVFAVDMESTVTGGEGPEVRAVQGGGNLFANPAVPGPAGPKQTVRTPPASGAGDTPGARGGVITQPSWAIGDDEVRPPYPDDAKSQEVEGVVTLKVCLDAEGKVISVNVLKGVGFGLDEAAADHARRRWRFEPAKRDGVPIPYCITPPVRFELDP